MIGLGMGFGLIFLVLMIGGGILLAIWLIRSLFPEGGRPIGPPVDPGLTPGEILDRRYARGEITREQYERMKLDLAE